MKNKIHLAKQIILENTECQLQSMKNHDRDKQRAAYELSLVLECGREVQQNSPGFYTHFYSVALYFGDKAPKLY